MSKAMRDKGYTVEAKHVGADYPNNGVNLPLDMAYVLKKEGKAINNHTSHKLAWAWAERLESQIIPA